ncbi:selenocysteine-specific translation elongation factor [Neofamilia massiliensis]|uniref:selenocysteine-specific translation elongation factor n=1 Tax=Neofamilia massiliensis TaxID=1673724 RepID=UPI0006BB5AEC|nr:selenocysteine-specific translation elongation factor [Neofamilia massiliensis]
MKYIILGTAGHIDHGKTTLIKALTGRDTDQLEEEKRRGISINLGFTYFDLPDGNRVGIIDAPGHERFVKNMMSGAVGIDIVLMVVSADDGVMPQTLEHAEILTYMGVKSSIIVITKADTVDEEMLDLVEADIRHRLKDTILNDAPIVKVDSLSKRGLDELIKLIQEKYAEVESKDQEIDLSTRLNVDRSFSLKGLGTVVTGTLLEGEITVDQTYELYPSKKEVKIRSIQVHGEDVKKAYRGQRTALNISNLSKEEISRGDTIASKNSLVESTIIDCKLKLSNHTDLVLEHWSRVRVFLGTREVLARIVPLNEKYIKKGDEAFVQLRLEEPVYCKIGDPFVLRSYSPVATIGGGRVLETISDKYNIKDTDHLKDLLEKEKFGLEEMVYDYIDRGEFGTSFADLYSYTGHLEADIEKNLEKLSQEEKIYKINDLYFSRRFLETLREKITSALKVYHKENPLVAGMKKEELREKVGKKINPKDFNSLLDSSVLKEKIKTQEVYVSLRDFEVKMSDDHMKISEEILEKLKKAEPGLLKGSDFASTKEEKKTLSFLLKNEVIKVDSFVLRRDYYQKIKEKLVGYLEENKEITVADFRDLNGFSRKMALALLEHFDDEKITKRSDDKRTLY